MQPWMQLVGQVFHWGCSAVGRCRIGLLALRTAVSSGSEHRVVRDWWMMINLFFDGWYDFMFGFLHQNFSKQLASTQIILSTSAYLYLATKLTPTNWSNLNLFRCLSSSAHSLLLGGARQVFSSLARACAAFRQRGDLVTGKERHVFEGFHWCWSGHDF